MGRCLVTALAGVIAGYLIFLGVMATVTPVVQRALNRKEPSPWPRTKS